MRKVTTMNHPSATMQPRQTKPKAVKEVLTFFNDLGNSKFAVKEVFRIGFGFKILTQLFTTVE